MTEAAPACVGLIMDGNRRWAKAKGMSSLAGHQAGRAKAKEIARHAFSRGVRQLIIYAFSTENWNRAPEEVAYLMQLFGTTLMEDLSELAEEGVAVRFVGELSRVPQTLRAASEKLEAESAKTERGKTLVVALSYGGRAEIVAAANALIVEGKPCASEEDFARALSLRGVPDPDLIIRTGGEKRLSNFLTWQSAYSELAFSDTLWPDFSAEELDALFADYAQRERRRGK